MYFLPKMSSSAYQALPVDICLWGALWRREEGAQWERAHVLRALSEAMADVCEILGRSVCALEGAGVSWGLCMPRI